MPGITRASGEVDDAVVGLALRDAGGDLRDPLALDDDAAAGRAGVLPVEDRCTGEDDARCSPQAAQVIGAPSIGTPEAGGGRLRSDARSPRRPSVTFRPMPDALIEKDGHILTVTMNRPARYNAMTLQMFARMADAWAEASADDDIRCVILTGAERQLLVGHGPAGHGRRRRRDPTTIDVERPHGRGLRLHLPGPAARRTGRPSRSSPRSRASPSPAAPRSCRAPTSASPGESATLRRVARRAGRSTRWAAPPCACAARSPTRWRPTSC